MESKIKNTDKFSKNPAELFFAPFQNATKRQIVRPQFCMVLRKLADRAFSRQGKNEKFSRQFYHNW